MVDDERFTRHWTQAQPIVASYINSIVLDFQEAEDLLQNVAVVLLRKFQEYDPQRSFVGWALGVARFEVLSARRSHARSFLSFREDLVEAIGAAYEELTPELKERTAALQECMRLVQGQASEMVKLRYEESLKPREIAARLGMAGGTVRVVLSRIRASLMQCVERRMAVEGE